MKMIKNSEIIEKYRSMRELVEAYLFDDKPLPSTVRICSLSHRVRDGVFSYEVQVENSNELITIKGEISIIIKGETSVFYK